MMKRETENLPQLSHDELSKIVTYFPLASLLELRLVSSSWNSTVIPNAAILKRTESDPWENTMIFCCGDGTRRPCFLPVWYQTIGPEGPPRQWASSSIKPITSPCVSKLWRLHPSLFASEGGLLFFKLTNDNHRREIYDWQSSPRAGHIADEFLVCNPLTGRNKFLTVPCAAKKLYFFRLVGVAICAAKDSYKLVVVRFYMSCSESTISVYDSLTSTWEQDIRHAGFLTGAEQWSNQGERSVSHNGILYWQVMKRTGKDGSRLMENSNLREIITYDVENNILKKLRAPGQAPQDGSSTWRETSHLYKIFENNPFSHIVSEEGELLTAFLSFLTSRSFTPSGLSTTKTLIKMHPEVLDRLKKVHKTVGFHYSSFRQKETVYHVVLTLTGKLQIVVQNKAQNWIVEVYLDHYFFPERHFWAFSSSWTAKP